MALVNFKKGLRSNLPATYSAGTFYVTTDERAIYLDVDDSSRIRIGDFQEFATVEALEANPNPNTTALYYVSSINCLAKWNGSEYIQINRDTGMTSVEVTGEGNAITAAVYSADGRKLTLTKGATYMTAADVDGKIADKVGAIEGTVKAYVDAKTEGIASDEALTALAGRVTTAEGEIDTLQAAIDEGGSVANAIKAAKDAADAAQATADSKTTMAEVEAKGYATKTEAQGYANAKDAAIQAAQAKADDAYELAGTKATMTEVNAAIEGAGHAVKSEVDTALASMESAYKAADTALETKLQVNINKKVDQTAYDTKVAALEGEDTRLAGLISGIDEAYKAADTAQIERIAALEADITGLSGAMHFRGVVDVLPETTEGYEDGDVVVCGQKEYVVNGEAFVELGDVSAEVQRITDLEGVVGKAAAGEEPATGLVKGVADNAAAIAAEKARAEGKEAELAQADIDNLAAAKKYTDDEITELNIAQYAKQTDLDAHTGNTVVHITADERTAWNSSEQNAKNYADGLKTAIDAAYAAADANLKTELQGYADQAEADAKAEAAEALATAKSELEGKITAAETAAKSHADTEVGKVKTALDEYKAANDAAVALKANAADVYAKSETFTKDEVNAAIEAAVTQAHTWGEF